MEHDWDGTEVITHDTNVVKAARFTTLREKGFTLATSRAECLALINEAWNKSRLPPDNALKAYVVLAFERSLKQVEIPRYRTGLSFFRSVMTDERVDAHTRQDLADKTLFLVSFFDGSITHRYYMCSREQLVNIGVSLYDTLWRESPETNTLRPTFRKLAHHFMQVVMVLQHVALPNITAPSQHKLREDLLLPSAIRSVRLAQEALEFYHMHLVPSGRAQ